MAKKATKGRTEKRPGKGMKLMPAISIKGGDVVVVNDQGDYEVLEDGAGKPLDPVDLAAVLLKSYPSIYIIDINGLERNKPQYDVLKDVCELGEVWVDGGVRFADALIDIIMAGASYGIMSTKAMASMKELQEAVTMSEQVVLGIYWSDGILSSDRKVAEIGYKELVKQASDMGVGEVVFADLGRMPGEGWDETLLYDLVRASKAKVYVGGGVREADVAALGAMGIVGAILDLKEIVKDW